MKEVLAIVIALASPLLFPWPLTLALVAVASVILPPLGILAGILTDALYYTPPVSIPYASLIGLLLSVLGYFVHRFIKTRIMTA